MARKRRPVRCRNCGYVTTPVSGFCPNCLERLPLGRRIGVVPIVAILGLVALGAAVVAASSTGAIALRPGAGQAAGSPAPTSASTSPASTIPTTPGAQSASPSAAVSPSSSGAQSGPPTPTVSPSATPSSTAAASPTPVVLGGQTTPRASGNLPSTATVDEVHRCPFRFTTKSAPKGNRPDRYSRGARVPHNRR